VIAVARLLMYLPQQTLVVFCAWIVGFFRCINTTKDEFVDRTWRMVQLYGASRCRTLRYLMPSALPFMMRMAD